MEIWVGGRMLRTFIPYCKRKVRVFSKYPWFILEKPNLARHRVKVSTWSEGGNRWYVAFPPPTLASVLAPASRRQRRAPRCTDQRHYDAAGPERSLVVAGGQGPAHGLRRARPRRLL